MDEAEFSLMLDEMQLHLNIWRSGRIWNLIFTIELRLQVADESDFRIGQNSAFPVSRFLLISRYLEIGEILESDFQCRAAP